MVKSFCIKYYNYYSYIIFEIVFNFIVKEQLAELSLLLAYQRESLIYLLEWIDMALNINDICLPFEKLYRVLEEMSSILTFAFGSEEFENYKSKSCIPLKDVALLLMKKVIYFDFSLLLYNFNYLNYKL